MRSARVLTVAAILTCTFGLGVPEATAKVTLIKACPTTITAAGSYLLDKSLTAIGTCITILTDFVTIDLSGHILTGNGTGSGISDNEAARRGIVLYNGTITNFDHGIDLRTSDDGEVRKIRAISNIRDGIRVMARYTVSDNIATSNGREGIVAGSYNTIEQNTASGNGGAGIAAVFSSTIKNNTASGNDFTGIVVSGNHNTISHNTASQNIDDGIVAFAGNTISNNTASGNGDDGIVAGPGNTISHNTTVGNGDGSLNGTGITADCSVLSSNIFGNTAQGNDIQAAVAGCQLSNNVGF